MRAAMHSQFKEEKAIVWSVDNAQGKTIYFY